MPRLRAVSLVLGCFIATLGRTASGQGGSIVAVAHVPSSRIIITGVAELRFGSVIPGSYRTIDPQTSRGAGRFEIRGTGGSEFELSMVLPTELRSDTAMTTMAVSFGPRAGCLGSGVQPVGCQYYDPATTLTARFPSSDRSDEVFSVWLGGTVQPTPDQLPGPYTGYASATVAYTAND